MLTGVLVIALPVSVFSDLWSEELKEVKGLESLFDEDSYDDDQHLGRNTDQERENLQDTCPLALETFRNGYQRVSQMDFQFELSKNVVVEREDMTEIVSSIRDIHEKQRRIQRILRKYLINLEDQQCG